MSYKLQDLPRFQGVRVTCSNPDWWQSWARKVKRAKVDRISWDRLQGPYDNTRDVYFDLRGEVHPSERAQVHRYYQELIKRLKETGAHDIRVGVWGMPYQCRGSRFQRLVEWKTGNVRGMVPSKLETVRQLAEWRALRWVSSENVQKPDFLDHEKRGTVRNGRYLRLVARHLVSIRKEISK